MKILILLLALVALAGCAMPGIDNHQGIFSQPKLTTPKAEVKPEAVPSIIIPPSMAKAAVARVAAVVPAMLTGVALAWDPSADGTVAGYRVYYGAQSRGYTNVVDVGGATTASVSNLVVGLTYYFAATAYTAAGLESDYSGEVSWLATAKSGQILLTVEASANLTNWVAVGSWVTNVTAPAQYYRVKASR